MKEYGVAVAAVRQAVIALQSEGLLRTIPGKGSENLKGRRPERKRPAAGETESRSEERDRDSRSGRRAFVLGVYSKYPPSRSPAAAKAQSPLMPLKTPGAGAEPQGFVNAKTPEGPESLASVRHLSISR
jgi:hypothetical protein